MGNGAFTGVRKVSKGNPNSTNNPQDDWGTYRIDIDETEISISRIDVDCGSAWCPPTEFCKALSIKHPEVKISLLYEEGNSCGLQVV
jgi:hypothetical protein